MNVLRRHTDTLILSWHQWRDDAFELQQSVLSK
jgi:hypothetical protein